MAEQEEEDAEALDMPLEAGSQGSLLGTRDQVLIRWLGEELVQEISGRRVMFTECLP